MTKEVKKEQLLLQEYKEGFSEVQKLVESFEAIEPDSQKTFIKERKDILNEQLEFLQGQRLSVHLEVREFLAETNSKLKTLLDTENFLLSQILECKEIEESIIQDSSRG